MNTSDWITISGIAAGFFVMMVGGVWHLSFKIGTIGEKISSIEKTLERVVNTIVDLKIEIAEIKVKVDILWRPYVSQSKSPLVLNEVGLRILDSSDIGKFAEDHYEEILSKVAARKPHNAYQVQELLISVVNQYRKDPAYQSRLQDAAFISGYDVGTVLFVGALSIRDRVVADLGFGMRIQRSDDL